MKAEWNGKVIPEIRAYASVWRSVTVTETW